jgi:L-iditol 2-dehydrogenase
MNREMDLETLVSHRFPLSQSPQAVELAAHPQPSSMKIMIQPIYTRGGSSVEGNLQ